jgi:hypothetical protein
MIDYLATLVPVFAAIAGALFTVISSLALGLCILRRLALPVSKPEEYVFAFFSGSAAFSLLVFVLLVAHAAYLAVILLAGFACVALFFLRFRRGKDYVPAPGRLSNFWWALALVFALVYTVLYLSRALGPEYSPDGVAYHLALVNHYVWKAHFPIITTNIYANFPEGMEMLFVAAFSIGQHSAAALVHLFFLFAEAAALVLFGLRFQIEKAAAGAMLLFYLSPIVGFDASVAYNDVALSGTCFALFYVLSLWASKRNSERKQERLLLLAGLLAGFAGTIKYTGFFAPLFAVIFVLWISRSDRRQLKTRVALVTAPAALLIAPWLVKNTIEVHNPVSPFANRVFRNPYTHISFEEAYREGMRHYNQVTLGEIPIEVTVKGVRLEGMIGPVFLLSPLALFALASPMGRQLLFAFLFFLVPYFGNIGTRFLLPALPFLALALSMVLASWPAWLVPVLVLHFVLSWPRVTRIYAPHAMRLEIPDWDETLRWVPEDWALRNRMPGYGMARYIDQNLPLTARIFEAGGVSEAYVRQRIDNSYQAAQNEKAYNLLWSGAFPEWRATERHVFHFASRQLRSVRVEQAAENKQQLWKVANVRFLSDGREIPPARQSSFASKPNPWDVRLAFDGNPVTVWSSWEHVRPGMYLEARFNDPMSIDCVEVDSPRDQSAVRMVVKGELPGGERVVLATTGAIRSIPSPPDFRKKVTAALRNMGYTHVALSSKQLCYQQVHSNPADWGMTLVAERGEYALFALNGQYSR